MRKIIKNITVSTKKDVVSAVREQASEYGNATGKPRGLVNDAKNPHVTASKMQPNMKITTARSRVFIF
ncbi:MAG: hypothetical protein KGI02_10045 [Thaumarchaeota archaeon]|nr:hypothetical protein [Nitrososphaerota archaeon]